MKSSVNAHALFLLARNQRAPEIIMKASVVQKRNTNILTALEAISSNISKPSPIVISFLNLKAKFPELK